MFFQELSGESAEEDNAISLKEQKTATTDCFVGF